MDNGQEKEIQEINCSVYLDRFEELEDGTAEAVLLLDEGGEEYSGELVLGRGRGRLFDYKNFPRR